ncbi:hypothetical protein CEXT_781161, partial [Caerostris extrusa]
GVEMHPSKSFYQKENEICLAVEKQMAGSGKDEKPCNPITVPLGGPLQQGARLTDVSMLTGAQ